MRIGTFSLKHHLEYLDDFLTIALCDIHLDQLLVSRSWDADYLVFRTDYKNGEYSEFSYLV